MSFMASVNICDSQPCPMHVRLDEKQQQQQQLCGMPCRAAVVVATAAAAGRETWYMGLDAYHADCLSVAIIILHMAAPHNIACGPVLVPPPSPPPTARAGPLVKFAGWASSSSSSSSSPCSSCFQHTAGCAGPGRPAPHV